MGSNLLYISIAYYMQKEDGWVQIACQIAYVLNGRPRSAILQQFCNNYQDKHLHKMGGLRLKDFCNVNTFLPVS